jgi:hypothetical protein
VLHIYDPPVICSHRFRGIVWGMCAKNLVESFTTRSVVLIKWTDCNLLRCLEASEWFKSACLHYCTPLYGCW